MPAREAADGARQLIRQPGDDAFRIAVVAGIGHGRTLLSAFDGALWHCGLHDYNLLVLSSVIPPRAIVTVEARYTAPDAVGDRLYVVKAEARSAQPGMVIGAGLGWLQWRDGQGVFVEHAARATDASEDALRAQLDSSISASLRDLAARRGIAWCEARIATQVTTTRVGNHPACALVVAIYRREGWHRHEPAVTETAPW